MSKYDKNRGDWSDAVRDSLRDAEQVPSPELWSRIESSARPVVGQRVVLARWGVAVAAMLLVGLFAADYFESDEVVFDEPYVVDSEPFVAEVAESSESAKVAEIAEVVMPKSAVEPAYVMEMEPEPELEMEPSSGVPEVTMPGVNEPEKAPESKSKTEPKKSSDEPRDPHLSTYKPIKYIPPKRSNTLAMNISGGGSANGTPARSPLSALGILSPSGYRTMSMMDLYEASDISHRQPLGFELTFGRSIAQRLSLVSGLSYTLLNSDLEILNGQNLVQRVQFIGVPVRLETPLLSGDRFSLYLGAGGAVEYCIAAKIGGESVDERRWHASVGGSVGAQYHLNQRVGIYCEPDLSYYLTPTNLITVRSESPLAFTMRFGVRFAL